MMTTHTPIPFNKPFMTGRELFNIAEAHFNGMLAGDGPFTHRCHKKLEAVTGARKVTAVLTIHPADSHGDRRWELNQGAILYDVTHLACRSARYTPEAAGGACSPASAKQSAFPVAPGGAMPPVEGCTKQDYAVLIVIGMGVEN